MNSNRFFHVKGFISAQTRELSLPLTPDPNTSDHDDALFEKHKKRAVKKLNARRKTVLNNIFMNQAINHISFQFLDIENKSLKFIHRSALAQIECLSNFTPETLKSYYTLRYSTMPSHKLLKISTILLESGQLKDAKLSRKLNALFAQYKREFARNKTQRKITRHLKNTLTDNPAAHLSSALLLPNTELMQAIGQVRSQAAITAAKVSRIQQVPISRNVNDENNKSS